MDQHNSPAAVITDLSDTSSQARPKIASFAFVAVLVGLGIPVWWHTTTVHRATLPYDEIGNLKSAPEHHSLRVLLKFQDSNHGRDQIEKFQRVSQKTGNFAVDFVLQEYSDAELSIVQQATSVKDIDSLLKTQMTNEGHDITLVELPERFFPSDKDVVIGYYRNIYLKTQTDHSVNVKLLEEILFPAITKELTLSQETAGMPPSTEYNILVTLATADFDMDFDMKSLISNYVQPFIKSIKDIADVKIRTQVIDVGNLVISGVWDSQEQHFRIAEDEAVTLINALEPKLGNQLSVVPTFQWVFYVPQERQSPMQIYLRREKENLNTVLSPRWGNGGIQIINKNTSLSLASLAETMITQLRLALGFPSPILAPNIDMLPYETRLAHLWEIDFVKRLRMIQFQRSTVKTLQSLCKLLSQISNIVISDTIGDDIYGALRDSTAANEALKSGSLNEALILAQRAFTAADRAFFHPSLLALLYFPDDQKYAIYIPLFLPVGIPIVLSMRPLLTWMLRKKEKAD